MNKNPDIVKIRQIWRPPALERVLSLLLCLAFFVIATSSVLENLITGVSDVLMLFFFIAGGCIFGLHSLSTSIKLTFSSLEIRNFGYRRDIPLGMVQSIRSSYWGTEIRYTNGDSWFCFAVQKSRIATWIRKETRADSMIETIMLAVKERARA